MRARTAWAAAKYVWAFGLLAWVVGANWDPADDSGLKHVYETHILRGEPLRYGVFALAVTTCAAAVVLTFGRWYVLVRAQGLPLCRTDAIRFGAIGLFFNCFLPGSVGGDIVKAVLLARRVRRWAGAVASVFMDRALGLWTLASFAAVAGALLAATGLLESETRRPLRAVAGAAGIVTSVTLLLWAGMGRLPAPWERFATWLSWLPRVGVAATEFWLAVWLYRRRWRTALVAVLLSGVSQAGSVSGFYLCALTLAPVSDSSRVPSLAEHFLIVPAGLMIRAVPLFPGGAGITEWGFAALYRWSGCPAANGVLAALVYRAVHWLLGLLGYLAYSGGEPVPQPPDHWETSPQPTGQSR